MSKIKLEGKECILPKENKIEHLLALLQMQKDIIDVAKNTLKDCLINMFKSIGEKETAQKIVKEGLPDYIMIYGEKIQTYKTGIISIIKNPLIEKGKILLKWNNLPKF